MKHIKHLTTILILTALLMGLIPMPEAMALSTSAPQCLLYVYLPNIINTTGNTNQQQQLEDSAQTNHSSDKPDFNGDGCADLAIGVPRETLDSGGNQGLVQVLYGSSMGVTAEHSQVWHRGGGYDMDGNFLGDIQGEFRANDQFGETLATGDFNNDGYTDLAIGIQYALASAHPNAGAVQIIYGSENGLTAANTKIGLRPAAGSTRKGMGKVCIKAIFTVVPKTTTALAVR